MRKGRILIVDDDPQILRVLSKILSKLECEVRAVGTGEEALELMEREAFDLMLLDLGLSGMSGIEVLKEAKKRTPGISVIVTTGYGFVENAIQAMKLGADDYLQKPFDIEQLRMVVQRALDRSDIFASNAEARSSKESEFEWPELKDEAGIPALGAKAEEAEISLKQAKARATEETESRLIKKVLSECKGNYSLAARKLGISRSALYYKVKKYKIVPS